MSNTNANLQTQTSNALHNSIMEVGGKGRPPMLAPGNYNPPYKFKWTEKTVPIVEGSSETTTEGVDVCPNACEMWKAIERLKQGESINVQDLETNLYWEFGKFTSRDGESLESYYSRFYKMMNELVKNQCDVTNLQVNVQFLLQLKLEWQRGKAIVNSPLPTYDQEPEMVAEDDALINRGTRYDNQRVVNVDGAKENVAYHKEKMLLCKQEEAGFQLNAKQADWRDDIDDEPGDQDMEAHYIDHPEQPESVNDAYLEEQGDTNITIDSLDMSTNRETVDQDDDDLARERNLLASLIDKLKCEIDDSKNCKKLLESSNKTLVDKLKGEIEDFKTKNKSLESSKIHFKEANNELKKTNQLMFKDLKKFQAELDRYHDVNYTSKVEIDCAKAKVDLMSYKMESQKSLNEYTQKINDLNQTILKMKKGLFAHQETISIMSQEKEA
ncbi:hypothetical protein Tco_0210101 [Tanacetum coccineum]